MAKNRREPIRFLLLLAGLLLYTCTALAAIPGIPSLLPVAMEPVLDTTTIPMYAGPTVQYTALHDCALNPQEPFVCFGQSDSWAMVAQGTPETFGSVGWIEAAAIPVPLEPDLGFTDRLPAMTEETAPLRFTPDTGETPYCTLERGESIEILARWNDMLYVETQFEDVPLRGFIPESAVE